MLVERSIVKSKMLKQSKIMLINYCIEFKWLNAYEKLVS